MTADYDLNPNTTEQIDRELKEALGVELEHEPFLTEQFSKLMTA